MYQAKKNSKGILACLLVAILSWIIGRVVPYIGSAVVALVLGMLLAGVIKDNKSIERGVKYTARNVIQWAVILLGFGLNLTNIIHIGVYSIPIIMAVIIIAIFIALGLKCFFKIPMRLATLIGVGSSVCGGAAIAATAPIIRAEEDEVAQSIAVVFLFNVISAIAFPLLGRMFGFSTINGEGFGIFVGTAINDTSSVTSAASTWDYLWGLGTNTLDTAITVKLTRTLAIIPITGILSYFRIRKERHEQGGGMNFRRIFPMYTVYFLLASLITTIAIHMGVNVNIFYLPREIGRFLIVLTMAAIGLNTGMFKVLKMNKKALLLGCCCWIGIMLTSVIAMWVL